jgi:hypothetical protein
MTQSLDPRIADWTCWEVKDVVRKHLPGAERRIVREQLPSDGKHRLIRVPLLQSTLTRLQTERDRRFRTVNANRRIMEEQIEAALGLDCFTRNDDYGYQNQDTEGRDRLLDHVGAYLDEKSAAIVGYLETQYASHDGQDGPHLAPETLRRGILWHLQSGVLGGRPNMLSVYEQADGSLTVEKRPSYLTRPSAFENAVFEGPLPRLAVELFLDIAAGLESRGFDATLESFIHVRQTAEGLATRARERLALYDAATLIDEHCGTVEKAIDVARKAWGKVVPDIDDDGIRAYLDAADALLMTNSPSDEMRQRPDDFSAPSQLPVSLL